MIIIIRIDIFMFCDSKDQLLLHYNAITIILSEV